MPELKAGKHSKQFEGNSECNYQIHIGKMDLSLKTRVLMERNRDYYLNL
jgi:hypothetical protein